MIPNWHRLLVHWTELTAQVERIRYNINKISNQHFHWSICLPMGLGCASKFVTKTVAAVWLRGSYEKTSLARRSNTDVWSGHKWRLTKYADGWFLCQSQAVCVSWAHSLVKYKYIMDAKAGVKEGSKSDLFCRILVLPHLVCYGTE